MHENLLVRDLLPAQVSAQEVRRYKNFELLRLPSARGVVAFHASARGIEGDERLVVICEVGRFELEPHGDRFRAPALETAYLGAIQALRSARSRPGWRRLAWNRITLLVRPTVHMSREAMEGLARRLGPATLDLGLENVMLSGRFALDGEAARDMSVEWSNPIGMGPRVSYGRPLHRPVQPLSRYEQRVMVARRRRLFYPYELVRWLIARDSDGDVSAASFTELDLADGGLVVVDREPGEHVANLVVGRMSNRSRRFAQGIERVLIIGDATNTMGSLSEPECVRIIAAIDLAERESLPVEWVALSSGAKIAFDSGTENLDWTARVLRRIIEFTQRGGVIHVVVDGPCVGVSVVLER